MDTVSKAVRSKVMSRIRSKNTGPELRVRSMLHRLGYRFRIHYAALPGLPDIVLPKYRRVIFVHGCFWHRHDCKLGKVPKSNTAYWLTKFERNKVRDAIAEQALRDQGWAVSVIWECQTRETEMLATTVSGLFAGNSE